MFLCEYFLLFYSVNSVTAVNIHFSNHKGSSGYGNKNNLSVNDSIKIATILFFGMVFRHQLDIDVSRGTLIYLYESQELKQLKEDNTFQKVKK